MLANHTSRFPDTPRHNRYDAVVVGSGPNGLSAAITLAASRKSVLLLEGHETIGGGMRSAELTLPGFRHDVCSAIHAMAVCSPFFHSVSLDRYGLEWIYPDAPVAHPLRDGRAAIGEVSVDACAVGLGRDAAAYQRLMHPLVENADKLLDHLLGPFRLPRHPLLLTRFGLSAIRSATGLINSKFATEEARALMAGHAAHSVMPLERKLTAAVGLMLAVTAHRGGWPVAKGGSQSIADALGQHLISLGGEIVVRREVHSVEELPDCGAVLLDVAPPALSRIAGEHFPKSFHRQLRRFRFGPAAYKLDWALDGPIPWRAEECRRAATVHVGGTIDEVAAAERDPWHDRHAKRPFVLVAQQSLFDRTRAPAGKQVAWGYCHVPNGSTADMAQSIEAQIERFAPGFRELILQRHVTTPADFEKYNANYVGGDITGGIMDLAQLFTRPTIRRVPYSTPAKNIYICSASTPPGAGVHGMCGYHAAQAALKRF